MGRVPQSQKFIKYVSKFLTFWTRLSENGVVMQLVFLAFLLPGNVIKVGGAFLFLKTIQDTVSPSEICIYKSYKLEFSTG